MIRTYVRAEFVGGPFDGIAEGREWPDPEENALPLSLPGYEKIASGKWEDIPTSSVRLMGHYQIRPVQSEPRTVAITDVDLDKAVDRQKMINEKTARLEPLIYEWVRAV